MNSLKKYVEEQISDEEKAQIIEDYELLETQGFIGDCLLRTRAEAYVKDIIGGDSTIVIWMDRLAMECCRYFAKKYLNGED